jgi:hypothetical protein
MNSASFFSRNCDSIDEQGRRHRENFFPGASGPESPREFSFVMIWRDLDSLKAFVGQDYTNPYIDPAEAEIVESRLIRHYDLVET